MLLISPLVRCEGHSHLMLLLFQLIFCRWIHVLYLIDFFFGMLLVNEECVVLFFCLFYLLLSL